MLNRNKLKISIIIVSYNTAEMTVAAIQSVYEQTKDIEFEVIVVDNASEDDSVVMIEKHFPFIYFIKLENNIGFAAANNLAVAEATGEFILLLNPDTLILDRAIEKLYSFACKNPVWGILGGSTFFDDGIRNPTSGWMKSSVWSMFCIAFGFSKIFRKSQFFNSESLENWDWSTPRKVDIVTGCFLLIRKEHWLSLGGFDKTFFMYGEDADLCLRAAKINLICGIVPDVTIIHYGGASEPVKADKLVRLFAAKGKLFDIHYSCIYSKILIILLKDWCLIRMISYKVSSKFFQKRRSDYLIWKEVWGRRSVWAN